MLSCEVGVWWHLPTSQVDGRINGLTTYKLSAARWSEQSVDLAVLTVDVSVAGQPFTKLDSVALQSWGGAVALPRKGWSAHARHAELGCTEARRCPLPQSWLWGALESGRGGSALSLSQAQQGENPCSGRWGRKLRESVLERGFLWRLEGLARRPLSTPALFLDFLGGAVHRGSPGGAHL